MSDAKQRNREQMPNVALLIDEFRAANPGLDFKVIYAEDFQTGHKIGNRPDESNVFVVPPNYFPSSTPPERQATKKGRRK